MSPDPALAHAAGLDVTEVAPGVVRMALPLGIHGVPTLSAYLLRGDGEGDTLVDCGIAVDADPAATPPDPCGALDAALRAAGGSLDRIARLVVTHAHIDHIGIAGEVVARSGGQLWLHERSRLDLDKYSDPDDAVDRREIMLADHGLYGRALAESATGLRDWMPVLGRIPEPDRWLLGGEALSVGGREWQVVHTPGHSPGHVCLWSATDRLLCSGDHLLQVASPPVTFERGFERDPMGSFLDSLVRVADLAPELVLPGHGPPFRDGARRAEAIARGKQARIAQVRDLVTTRERTATELTEELFPRALTGAQLHFAMAEVLAYLAHHEVRGVLARSRRPDGVYLWRVITDREA